MALLTIPWFQLDALQIPGTTVSVSWFGLFVITGVFSGLGLATWHGRRQGIRAEVIKDAALHCVVTGFLLGHVFDLMVYHPEKLFARPWLILTFWQNLSSFGGVFGSVIGGFLWAYRRGMPLLRVYDSMAFGFPLGWMLGRIGCFVVHDHPGAQTDFWLGVRDFQYPGLTVATRHDLGLYEVFWSAAVLILFLWLNRVPRGVGLYTWLFAVLYAPFRFGLDFLREADATYAGLTPGHYASVFSLLIGVSLWRYTRGRAFEELPPQARIDADEPWPPAGSAS